jgi:hypothetical protein
LFSLNLPVGEVRIAGVDLTVIGSGKSLFSATVASRGLVLLENCKLNSAVSITTGSVAGQGGVELRLVNCDGADTNYRYQKTVYQGTITSNSVVYRSGGATAPGQAGSVPVSRKMVTTADSKFYSPLESDAVEVFFPSDADLAANLGVDTAVTATVEIVTDGVTLTDAEAWLEVEYPSSGGHPLSAFANDRAADILATPANQTSSSVTWTTTGLTSPTKQKLSVTFTPKEMGVVKLRVMLAKASTTLYFCPKPTMS